MKNTLTDLNNHLFAQLERLDNEDLDGDALKGEIERARALTGVASQIIANGQLVLRSQSLVMEVAGRNKVVLPEFLEDSKNGLQKV